MHQVAQLLRLQRLVGDIILQSFKYSWPVMILLRYPSYSCPPTPPCSMPPVAEREVVLER